MDCANLDKCGFIQKYGSSKAMAVNGFVLLYCKGEKQAECLRKKFKEQKGVAPSDDMLPNGAMISK